MALCLNETQRKNSKLLAKTMTDDGKSYRNMSIAVQVSLSSLGNHIYHQGHRNQRDPYHRSRS